MSNIIRDKIKEIQKAKEAALRDLFLFVDPVLDRGYVDLIDFMGDDDAHIDAARVSFAKSAAQFTETQNDGLSNYLSSHNHTTPAEMAVFKFRVKAPVIAWWHWVRHRMASYNFVSGRYVPYEDDEVYTPTQWRKQSKDNKQGSSGDFLEQGVADFINNARDDLYEKQFELYQYILAQGGAREEARLVIPFAAVYYEAIFMTNARSLKNFIDLRNAPDAQFEIREYAAAIQSIVSKTHPRIFEPHHD